jgi:hypothetical protein
MKIVFVSNFLNQHQFPLAQELWNLTGGNYRFIETIKAPIEFIKIGYPQYEDSPWLIRSWKGPEHLAEAEKWVKEADVMVGGKYDWIQSRLNAGKMVIEVRERWLKKRPYPLTGCRNASNCSEK